MSENNHLTRQDGRPAAPVRIVHLGLGNFFRAHTCWYTEHARDRDQWGIAAFSGRSATHVDDLQAQDNLYTLVIQGPEESAEIISAISAVHVATDLDAWRGYFADPQVCIVTSTITEAGYLRDAWGALDIEMPQVIADVKSLRADPAGVVTTAPGKFVAGLLARRSADAGPITFVPCDNVVSSGAMAHMVITQMAAAVDPSLLDWMRAHVSFVSTMVDRITPSPGPDAVIQAEALTGFHDPASLITEPFTEWVLQGDFAGDRPAWESAGAQFVDDIVPFEHRKLWLLNGAHSLMAYAAPWRGHETVQQAIADPEVWSWVEAWWDEASPHLPLPEADVMAYRQALLTRFTNPRMRDVLSRIAADGSQKLPIRFLPTMKADLDAGRDITAGLRAVAAWVLHLRASVVNDARQAQVLNLVQGDETQSVTNVLEFLGLPADLTSRVLELIATLTHCPDCG